jgi:hypothetical protein
VEVNMAKHGESASKNVESTMRRRKKGTLKSGTGRTVKSRRQAIAIGLSEPSIEKGAYCGQIDFTEGRLAMKVDPSAISCPFH